MIELVLVACLISAPEDCREFPVEIRDAGLLACVAASVSTAATWAAEHPAYRVARVVCGPPRGVRI